MGGIRSRLLARSLARVDRLGLGDRRSRLAARAKGRVLIVGCGTGADFAHLRPQQVHTVVAVEPDPYLMSQAERAAEASGVPIELRLEAFVAERFERGSFDTVISTLLLCSIDDPRGVIRGMHDVLADDGELLFLEHHRSVGWRGVAQRVAQSVWSVFSCGCRLDRDTVLWIREAGFAIDSCDRFRMPGSRVVLNDVAAGVARPGARFPTRRRSHTDAHTHKGREYE